MNGQSRTIKLIDKKVPSYETQSIVRSRVSDIAFLNNKLYLSGSKHHQTQGEGNFNFILVLNLNGDSVAVTNLIDPQSPLSSSWDASGNRPKIHIIDNQIYTFTSLHNWTSALGSENINVLKYDTNLNLLKNVVFDGLVSASRDTVKYVEFFDNKFIIHSMMAYWPRLLACDTSLGLIWDTHFRTNPSSNHTTLPFIINDSNIYTYPTTRDTSRKNPPIYYNKFAGHIRIYNLSGTLLDSIILFQTITSDDNITDALIINGNNYVTGLSIDSGTKKVFITKLDKNLQPSQNILLGENPLGKVQLESDGCRLYLSFIDSVNTGEILKLLRLDENLNVLSEDTYYSGKDKNFSLSLMDKHIKVLSTNKNTLTDTLSLKHLSDTLIISEPFSFNATAINPRSIELHWQLSNGLSDTVIIYKGKNNENYQLLKAFPFHHELTFIDSNLQPSTKYYYSIQAKWQHEYSCNELFASDSTPFNIGVQKFKAEHFQVYPNPTKSEIKFKGTEDIEEIEIMTVTGQIIKRYSRQEVISVKDFPSGVYFLRINKLYLYKIIKQ